MRPGFNVETGELVREDFEARRMRNREELLACERSRCFLKKTRNGI